ncbi:MAG: hypothetical protein ACLTGU_01770 [Escherichia coli]
MQARQLGPHRPHYTPLHFVLITTPVIFPVQLCASTLVREMAARFTARDQDGLRRILLLGASGFEALRSFDTYLKEQGTTLVLVLDNAHRVPAENLLDVLNATTHIRFVLLCQPHENVRELEVMTGLQREGLQDGISIR